MNSVWDSSAFQMYINIFADGHTEQNFKLLGEDLRP